MSSVATCSVLRTLLLVIVHGHFGVFASPIPYSSESSLTNTANTKPSAFRSSALATFSDPCLVGTNSNPECGTDNAAYEQLRKVSIQIEVYLEDQIKSYSNVASNCDEQDLVVLHSTKVTLSKCDAANNAAAHKAVVNLQLFSHFMMNVSSVNAGTRQYSQFYGNITDFLQQMSCPMKCSTDGGLDSTNLQTFIRNLQKGEAVSLFQEGDGFLYRTDVSETAFSMYQCSFLKRANETFTNLNIYYNNYRGC